MRQHMKHLGFVQCAHCGDRQLFKAYQPGWMGWEYWCYSCGAKDELARPPAQEPSSPLQLRVQLRLNEASLAKMGLRELQQLYAKMLLLEKK